MLAGAYRVKDWHQIRQALPGAGAGAELVVLVVRPGAGRAGAGVGAVRC